MAKLSGKRNGRELLRFERLEPASEGGRAYRSYRVYMEGGKVLGRASFLNADGTVANSKTWRVVGTWDLSHTTASIIERRTALGWTLVSSTVIDPHAR